MGSLSTDSLNTFKKKLLLAKSQIAERIAALKKQDPFQNPDRVNDNAATDTEAAEEADHDRVASLLDELTRQEKEVDTALVRMGDGTYGVCQNCSNPIEESRLAILPTATLCLKCEKLK